MKYLIIAFYLINLANGQEHENLSNPLRIDKKEMCEIDRADRLRQYRDRIYDLTQMINKGDSRSDHNELQRQIEEQQAKYKILSNKAYCKLHDFKIK